MHGLHHTGPQTVKQHSFSTRTDQLRQRFPEAAGKMGVHCLTECDRRAAALEGFTTKVCPLHWDYKPQNTFVTKDRIIGFDMAPAREGVALHDVALFLTEWERQRSISALGGKPWPNTINADRRAFLRGYGVVWGKRQRLLSLLELFVLTRRFMRQETRVSIRTENREATRLALVRRVGLAAA